jgi:hypothetical protein
VVTVKLSYVIILYYYIGTRGSVVVKALYCKPEGRGLETW